MRKALFFLCSLFCASCLAGAALADTTITITNSACKDPVAPAEVAPPASPNAPAGISAMRNKNYAQARANFRPLAEGGDPEGMRLYGAMLMDNCTGLQDKPAAVNWLTKAMEAGDVPAQTQLGHAYENGDGVAQDDGKAFDLFTKAAASGNANAENELGYFYQSGRGVASDKYQAVVWFVKAGEQGNPVALVNIAEGYFKGKSLPQDTERAAYYMFAAYERCTPAQRARFANSNNDIVRQLSQDDLQHIAARARRWSPGPRSLSDVLDDAAHRRDKGA
jgi:hypothetical protein